MKKLTRNIFLLFSLFSLSFLLGKDYTSITDYTGFPLFCKKVIQDPEAYANFRNHKICKEIVDTVTQKQGQQYLQYIINTYPYLLEKMNSFQENDKIGNPLTYPFLSQYIICPTTLRYMKIAGDIISLLDSTPTPIKIVEIGGGYGGQCKILFELLPISEYIIIDLPEVLELTKKYLQSFNIPLHCITFLSPEQLKEKINCDLLISNYAFSECAKKTQLFYMEKILNHAQHGYMICNYLPSYGINCLSQQDVYEILYMQHKTCHITKETPLTYTKNYVITW